MHVAPIARPLEAALQASEFSEIIERCTDVEAIRAVLLFLKSERFKEALLGKL